MSRKYQTWDGHLDRKMRMHKQVDEHVKTLRAKFTSLEEKLNEQLATFRNELRKLHKLILVRLREELEELEKEQHHRSTTLPF